MRTKFEDAANIDDDGEDAPSAMLRQDNSIRHLHNPPPPHYHHQTKASLRPARSRKGTCGARINFRWVHIGHFSKNGLIENTHTFCGKIQEVSLNVWRNTMDSKGQICEKIMFVSICGVGRTQTMASGDKHWKLLTWENDASAKASLATERERAHFSWLTV